MNSLTYPGGDTVRYERNRAGRVTAVVDSVAGRTEMGYDLLGRQISQRWPNGLTETRTYDSASRLLAITPGQQDKKGAPTITYSYDQRGNKLTMDRSDVGLSRYTYDAISQLLTAELPDGDVQTYTFDAVGNRLSLKDRRGLQTYSYDDADELLEVESDFNPEGPAMPGALMASLGASDANKALFKTTYGWDADGNMVNKTGPGNRVNRYGFDSLDRLVGVSNSGFPNEKYLYNADGRRIGMGNGEGISRERTIGLSCGLSVLLKVRGNGEALERYIALPSGEMLGVVGSGLGSVYSYHYDALGNTVALSDRKGLLKASIIYDPYGSSLSGLSVPFGFVGERSVESVCHGKMLAMGMRFYDVATGRFLSMDPLRRYGESALTFLRPGWFDRLHPYAYAANNPVTRTDPYGLACGSGWNDYIVPDSVFPFFNFTVPCQRHDKCYDSGLPKGTCDDAFLSDMQGTCGINVYCWGIAQNYYYAVKYGAGAAYQAAQSGKCAGK